VWSHKITAYKDLQEREAVEGRFLLKIA
jgi:hypothetical protein